MKYNNILFEVRDGIAILTINRPKALNALNIEVVDELDTAFRAIEADNEIKAVILTGAGRAFVAGADIAEMAELNTEEGKDMIIKGHKTMKLIETIGKPVIAAVNGYALGGGNELAMACDIRIASEEAKFGQPELNLGIIPGYGGTQRLARLVGKGMAKKLIYSAEIIDASEAYRIGLVEELVPADELMKAAENMARTIISKAPIAFRMAKQAINEGMETDLDTGLQIEVDSYMRTFASEDREEGMQAFLGKRPANFKNY